VSWQTCSLRIAGAAKRLQQAPEIVSCSSSYFHSRGIRRTSQEFDTFGFFEQNQKANHLIPLPPGMTFETGAAITLQEMTAHSLVYENYLVTPGITVLVHAAAGGMGLVLVQWLKHLGARVIGTVSTEEKAQAAREAGADHVILTPGKISPSRRKG
jgi:NADPH:quinone reductase-like Zn-dependent oxidoreductase